ncbi:MAG: hypothetical protein QXD05_01765 [Candidatus Pacearchaeota archaeon]
MINETTKKGHFNRFFFNIKAQGVGTTELLWIIIGIIAVVLIIAGVSVGFDKIFGGFNVLPDDLTKMATACKTYSETAALRLSYCQFNEGRIQGIKGWYNCPYIYRKSVETLGQDKVDWSDIGCASDVERNQCQSLKNDLGDLKYSSKAGDLHVNDKTCDTLLPP